jgi:hypothetical protein
MIRKKSSQRGFKELVTRLNRDMQTRTERCMVTYCVGIMEKGNRYGTIHIKTDFL